MGPEAFFGMPGVSKLRPCTWTYLKKKPVPHSSIWWGMRQILLVANSYTDEIVLLVSVIYNVIIRVCLIHKMPFLEGITMTIIVDKFTRFGFKSVLNFRSSVFIRCDFFASLLYHFHRYRCVPVSNSELFLRKVFIPFINWLINGFVRFSFICVIIAYFEPEKVAYQLLFELYSEIG